MNKRMYLSAVILIFLFPTKGETSSLIEIPKSGGIESEAKAKDRHALEENFIGKQRNFGEKDGGGLDKANRRIRPPKSTEKKLKTRRDANFEVRDKASPRIQPPKSTTPTLGPRDGADNINPKALKNFDVSR